ncbi:MAG TPA: hypothetical protein VKG91_17870 [Roseiarcus sp.]|nr:hypothetical protein [Roseiarcus sp.]
MEVTTTVARFRASPPWRAASALVALWWLQRRGERAFPSLVGGADSVSAIPVSAAPVPELSTWVMMLTGFAGLGFAGYRRAKKGHATFAA